MFGIGSTEILLIFLVVLLFFGGRKIPEVARGLGKALGEFKKARDDFGKAVEDGAKEGEKAATAKDADKAEK
jgi:sec-independent protein translocase protein TatA